MGRNYEEQRTSESARSRARSEAGRDIGEIPAVADPARKARAERDFRLFCETYFPTTFSLAWSGDHLTVVGQIEESVLRGGLFATAMPRGSGKTTLAETACIWAILYGHRDFIALIGSDEGHALQMLDSIKTELEANELLQADFPEAVYPIARLEGIAHRCKGQTCAGERTHIGWAADQIIMPTIPGSKASGAIVRVAGITGGVRGMKHKRADGKTARPSLVVVDDPQTDQSARSPSQCESRERILAGAILGLAGPGKKISGIMPCTVIREGDIADRILDRKLHPEWNGTRTKMVYAFPSAEKLWEEYAQIRADSFRAGHAGIEATQFYLERRSAMDEGAVIAWPARFNPDEVSAVQHAMNLKLLDERAFFAEYQNQPMGEATATIGDLTPDQIAGKLNRLSRGRVPLACSRVTGFIDVQGSLLFFTVAAWTDDFTGYIVDYGAFPRQGTAYFLLRDAKQTLAKAFPAAGLEGQIYAGLDALAAQLCGREWIREDGAGLRIDRILIDANWGGSTETVYQFCRQSAHAAALTPSHGKYYGAATKPMREEKKQPGDRVGLNWRVPNARGRRQVRYVVYDTNYWKSFVHARLATAMGDRGCLSLFGDKEHEHRMFAHHLCAEYRVRTQGRGREVDEWKSRPERPDNHFFDCLVGAAVAASMEGASLAEARVEASPERRARPKVSFAEMYRQKNA